MKAKLSLMVLWVSLGIAASQAATNQVVYFLVGFVPWRLEEFNSHDSFILPLTDSKDIAHARDLVRALNEYLQSSDPFKRFPPEGVDALQVAAFFAKSSDGINCNYLAPGKPL
jgi:type IV secretory pathway TrbF-like protein